MRIGGWPGDNGHAIAGVLERSFPDWTVEGFRTAMDLERSFGPAYARGWLVRV